MVRPRVNSSAQQELDRAQASFNALEDEIKDFNPLDCKAPEPEIDPLTKLSKKEMDAADAPYIKPIRSMTRPDMSHKYGEGGKVHFNEKYRKRYERDWEWVKVIVDNYELIGQNVEIWTGEWGCDPAYEWSIPTNRPVYLPRFVARRIKKCRYHELHMGQGEVGAPHNGANVGGGMQGTQFYGNFTVKRTKQRLDANLYTEDLSSGF